MPHDEAHAEDQADTREFWEQFYGEREQVWSGRPNVVLVEEIEGMAPGHRARSRLRRGRRRHLAGERGWQVTAADISQAALDRAAAHAADRRRRRPDHVGPPRLLAVDPRRPFDLVSAHFLHSPVDDPRDAALRAAAEAVGPGGTLLVVSHEAVPWHEHMVFPTAGRGPRVARDRSGRVDRRAARRHVPGAPRARRGRGRRQRQRGATPTVCHRRALTEFSQVSRVFRVCRFSVPTGRTRPWAFPKKQSR